MNILNKVKVGFHLVHVVHFELPGFKLHERNNLNKMSIATAGQRRARDRTIGDAVVCGRHMGRYISRAPDHTRLGCVGAWNRVAFREVRDRLRGTPIWGGGASVAGSSRGVIHCSPRFGAGVRQRVGTAAPGASAAGPLRRGWGRPLRAPVGGGGRTRAVLAGIACARSLHLTLLLPLPTLRRVAQHHICRSPFMLAGPPP